MPLIGLFSQKFCRFSKALRSSSGPQAPGGFRCCFILGAWRHLYKRYPLTYDPNIGDGLSLGMCTACTIRLSQALELPFHGVPPLHLHRLIAWLGLRSSV